MTKRKAEYDLDRDQISKEDFEYTKNQKEEEIAQRRILKIKSSGKPEVESSQPKFTLSRPLNIETKPSEAKEVSFGPPVVTNPPSFVIKTKIETERKEEFNEKKKEKELVRIIQTDENKEMPKFSLFTSNLAVKRPVQEEISPFSFIQTAMANKEAVGGFFPKPAGAAGLFSKPAEEDLSKKPEENQTKIFVGKSLDLVQQPVSLSSTKPAESETTNKPSESLFAKIPESSLFSKTPQEGGLFEQPSGLFGKPSESSLFSKTPEGGLFSQPPEGGLFGKPLEGGLWKPTAGQSSFANLGSGSLFGNLGGGMFSNVGGAQRIKGDDEDNDGEDNNEPVEPSSPEIEKDKSSGNYQYEEVFVKIISKNIHKFKVNEKDTMEGGYLSIEKKKDNEKAIMVVYRNQAKLVLYQGWVLKGLSLVGVLNKRADSMTLTLYNEKKGEGESKGKMEKDLLKIMFGNQSDCEEFKKKLEEYV